MPAGAKASAAATSRPVIPLAAVTRRQARRQAREHGSHRDSTPRTSPISPNPFEPLRRISGEPDHDGNSDSPATDADTTQRPRANSAPLTPSRPALQPTALTAGSTAQLDRQTTALLARSPVRTSNVATGRAGPTKRAVAFNLPNKAGRTTAADLNADLTENESVIVVRTTPQSRTPAGTAPQSQTAVRTAPPRSPPSPAAEATTPAPPSAWDVTRDTLSLYENVQHVAAGVDRLIQDHLRATHPAEALLLGQLVTDAFRAFSRPPNYALQRSESSHSSYASTAASMPRSTATYRSTSTTDSRASRSSQAQAQAQTTQAHRPPTRTTGQTRIFIRLPTNHPLRHADPVAVREQANNAVPRTPDLFTTAYPVASGYALVVRDQAALETALASHTVLETNLGATAVEKQEHWESYILSPVPRRIHTLNGPTAVDTTLTINEITLVTGATPCRAQWTRRSESSAYEAEGEMVLYLPRDASPPPSRFRLFGRQANLRPIRKARASLQACETCHQHHGARICHRKPRCGRCGLSRHDAPDCCTRPARCINCRGPHEAADPNCPARPYRDHGVVRRPNRQQLQAIRAAGSRAWTAANTAAEATNPRDTASIQTDAQVDTPALGLRSSMPSRTSDRSLTSTDSETDPHAGARIDSSGSDDTTHQPGPSRTPRTDPLLRHE